MRLRLAGVLLLVFALLAAACGDSDDDAESTTTTGEAPATTEGDGESTTTTGETSDTTLPNGGATDVGVTADTIRVSQVVSLTGVNAAGQAGFELGFEAYVEALNEAGGVHGRTIEIVNTRDDNSQPDRQRTEYIAAVEQDETFAVFGSWPSFGGAEYGAMNDVITIGASYDPDNWNRSDSFFGVTGGTWEAPDPENIPDPPGGQSLTSRTDVYIMAKQGKTRMGGFGYTQAGSANSATDSCEYAEEYDMECVYVDTSLEFGFTDLGASVQAIRDSGAEHFYAAMDIGGCVTILRSFLRAGLEDATLRCAVGYGQETIDDFADLIENLFISIGYAPFESTDVPEMVRFIEELEFRKPGTDPSITVLNGWLAGIFFEEVLEEVGPNLTKEAFIETARSAEQFSEWNARDISGSIDWTTNRWELYSDPDYILERDECGGYLLRPDLEEMRWAQVGETPQLCLGEVGTAEDLAAKVESDTSSLEP